MKTSAIIILIVTLHTYLVTLHTHTVVEENRERLERIQKSLYIDV